jgi:hypothetical protein
VTPEQLVALREDVAAALIEAGIEVRSAGPAGAAGKVSDRWSDPNPWSDRGREQAGRALDALDPDMSMLDWVKVGMAIHDGTHGAQEGLDLWDSWSSGGEKYKPGDCRRRWLGFKPGHGTTRASLFKNDWPKAAEDVDERTSDSIELDAEDDGFAPLIDWKALAANPPPPKRAVLKNWLYEGTVCLFAGHGGVGKSMLGLQLAVHLALGVPVLAKAATTERVIFYSCEDDESTLYWRAARICKSLGRSVDELDGVLLARDFTQSNAIMYSTDNGAPQSAPDALRRLEVDIADFGATVAFVDNASDVFNGNEVVRAQVRQFVRQLQHVAGKCSVVLVAHVDKASARNPETSQGYSGSTAWNNSVRSRWYLYPQEDGALTLELQKSNYGKSGEKFGVAYDEGLGVFTMQEAQNAQRALEGVVLTTMYNLLAKGTKLPVSKFAPANCYKQLKSAGAIPKSMSAGQCEDMLIGLQQARLLEVEVSKGANRAEKEYWVLTAAGKELAQ